MKDLILHKRGQGHPILLIHGFPMNATIWDECLEELSKHGMVFTVNLPGFGGTQSLPEGFSIADVASEIFKHTNNIPEPFVVAGHSLGGYVALAMADLYPDRIAGLCLIHSTALPDTEEKKISRNKVTDFIQENGAKAFTSNFIFPLFSDKNHPAIARVRKINMESAESALIGYTKAMRDRPDSTHVLKTFQKPICIIGGDEDPGIPMDTLRMQTKLSTYIQLNVLKAQAHMSFIEDRKKTLSIIEDFMSQCFSLKAN